MPKVKNANTIAAIKKELREGKSVRKIAEKCHASLGFISKLRQNMDLVPNTNKAGRPQKLCSQTKRTVRRLILSGAVDNAVEARNAIAESLNTRVCSETIRRCLKDSGMKAKTKIKKPLLTVKHKASRLAFAKQHADWNVNQWKLVTWSDESKINRLGSDGRVWSWFDKKVGLTSRNIQETLKFGGGSLMIWGCFQGNKLGVLRKIEGIMKAADYIAILEDSYLPSLEKFGCEPGDTVFMQNNDPKHKAKITMNWLRNRGITCMDWPAQSPDINPIENLWNILKKKIIVRNQTPQNLEQLWVAVNEEWSKISPEILENLVASMPKRMQLIIKAKGGHIKY